jgi:RNA polymerase-binding transcription factor DksA
VQVKLKDGIDDEGNEISEARLNAIPWADKAI